MASVAAASRTRLRARASRISSFGVADGVLVAAGALVLAAAIACGALGAGR